MRLILHILPPVFIDKVVPVKVVAGAFIEVIRSSFCQGFQSTEVERVPRPRGAHHAWPHVPLVVNKKQAVGVRLDHFAKRLDEPHKLAQKIDPLP